jgi:hypothetical protein
LSSLLTPEALNVREKVRHQRLDASESVVVFAASEVAVVTLAGLIVIAKQASPVRGPVIQSVFQTVRALATSAWKPPQHHLADRPISVQEALPIKQDGFFGHMVSLTITNAEFK